MRHPISPIGAGPLAEAINLHQRGKLNPARKLYKEALAKQPTNVQALEMYGTLLGEMGDHAEAARIFARVTEINPASLLAHFNRGMSLRVTGNLEEAEACFRAALALAPERAIVHLSLGEVVFEQNRRDEAIEHYRRAIALDTGLVNAHMNLGQALTLLGRHAEAVDSFATAIKLAPDAEDAKIELGRSLATVRRFHDAFEVIRRAAEQHPGSHVALRHYAAAFRDLGRNEEAHDTFERALALKPDALDVMLDLIRLKRVLCRWSDLERLERKALQLGRKQEAPLDMTCLMWIEDDPVLHRRIARSYPRVEDIPEGFPAFVSSPRRDRIRIGYFSANLGENPVGHAVLGLFARHDRTQFDVHAFSLAPGDGSATRSQLEGSVEHMHDVAGLESTKIVEFARNIGLDIAVDLNGHTPGARTSVFRARVASVQVNAIGYPGTLDLPSVDYILADRFVMPPGADQHFAEKIVRLPQCYLPSDLASVVVPPAPPRASQGLPEQGFVFGAFGDGTALGLMLFSCWMRLLKGVEGSVLWLSNRQDQVKARIRQEAEAWGVDGGRIVFTTFASSRADHLARLRLADLALDTSPYNGGTAASDALRAGVPTLTVAGRAFPSRVTGSILNAAGLPDLSVDNLQDYEALARDLALQPDRLAAIRDRLDGGKRSVPLFDLPGYVGHLEAVYRRMVEHRDAGLEPQSVATEMG